MSGGVVSIAEFSGFVTLILHKTTRTPAAFDFAVWEKFDTGISLRNNLEFGS